MGNSQRHRIGTAARRIDKANIGMLAIRRTLEHACVGAGFNRLARDERLNVSSELGDILGTSGGCVPIHRTVNNRLRQIRVEVASSTLGNQDRRITVGSVVTFVSLPKRAPSGIRWQSAVLVSLPGPDVLRSKSQHRSLHYHHSSRTRIHRPTPPRMSRRGYVGRRRCALRGRCRW